MTDPAAAGFVVHGPVKSRWELPLQGCSHPSRLPAKDAGLSQFPAIRAHFRKRRHPPAEVAWKALAALLALALHLPVLHWLMTHPRPRTASAAPDARVQLRLLSREVPAVQQTPPAHAATGKNTGQERSATFPAAPTPATAAPGSGSDTAGTPAAPLDLSLPAHLASEAPARSRNPLEPPAAIDYRPTRFNHAWAPDGGPIQQTWAFRSRLAGALLGATGALDRPCTEAERRQRLKRCAGAQYQGDEHPATATP